MTGVYIRLRVVRILTGNLQTFNRKLVPPTISAKYTKNVKEAMDGTV